MPDKFRSVDLILASASPRRQELLKKIVAEFRVVASEIDEQRIRERNPVRFTRTAAFLKARAVGERFPSSLILAADTVVSLGNTIFGKPRHRAEARGMLEKLSGRRHSVITAVALFKKDADRGLVDHEVSFVRFKKLNRDIISTYLDNGSFMDKAGSYAIQEVKKMFIEDLEGDYDNVVGLPVRKVKALLRRFLDGNFDIAKEACLKSP